MFAREHVKGTFVLRDEATGCTRATDLALAHRGYRPMSTFKLPNAIIGSAAVGWAGSGVGGFTEGV